MSAAEFRTVRLEFLGPIAKLAMLRPDCANRLNGQMCEELHNALETIRSSQAHVLILTGSSYAFCGGSEANCDEPTKSNPAHTKDRQQALIAQLRSLPQLVIAAVNGRVAGIGATIALACDIVIAAKCARFCIGDSSQEDSLDEEALALLARALGPSRMLAMTLFGESLNAEQAAQCGLIWSYVQTESLDREVTIVAKRLAATPTGTLQRAKHLVRSSWQHELRRHATPAVTAYSIADTAVVDEHSPA